MSFKVKVIIDEEERNVLSYSFNLSKGKDVNGKPTTKTVLHELNIKLESNNKTDLMEWMISPNQTKQIELHIQARQGEKTRILYFADATLVGLDTTFSATGNTPMTDDLQITAAGLNTNDSTTEYSAYWRTTFPQKKVEPTTLEQPEPTFLGYHFENENREKVKQEKIQVNQNVVLIIETENGDNDTITINLNDNRLDFEYNGIVLKNDTLNGVIITGQQTEVQLKAVAQQN